MTYWQVLWMGIRPATLLLGVSPVILGSALGYQHLIEQGQNPSWINGLTFLAALAVVVLMQSAANLVNDAEDAASGVDNDARRGPLRVVQAGLMSQRKAKDAYQAMLGLAVFIGLLLTIHGGWSVLAVAIVSAAVAYLYTGGPKPLSHLGLGEVVAIVFFGPVAVLGSAYLQSLTWQWSDLLWSMGPGLLAGAVMAINNLRDRRGDERTGKRTLAIQLGDRLGQHLPWYLVLASVAVFFAYALWNQIWLVGLILSFVMLRLLRASLKPLIFPRADLLNKALKLTSIFVAVYCAVYALVVVL
ncbi:1,4-dihydroxy-2-naphthoate octaprenyltransferase [Pseudobacteriovorax antillogorgiicola]|uniref:1,4-dihydroxy-2-naphthoate octaprenyltransferase n=1 Tax=Pseudobacteriovorax antillogorgiicola TaxID=1513793 RepID=A0A1Y6BAM1_9BACT|nr:1,4-dihydroxy-2-naphthoate octaprenyltransferase [Pseudobacteriovorax antillogorgiicola]TCS58888.1 1,4-dihydroxy-2-naphthoate prenyltransferase [Pseudobacteriovorax antillogorgiicola]SME93576.1 1,4-dihydroxy-2-naphthoate prenyltransferase [Pseudobacteriovorax antillogorgiicola]